MMRNCLVLALTLQTPSCTHLHAKAGVSDRQRCGRSLPSSITCRDRGGLAACLTP